MRRESPFASICCICKHYFHDLHAEWGSGSIVDQYEWERLDAIHRCRATVTQVKRKTFDPINGYSEDVIKRGEEGCYHRNRKGTCRYYEEVEA